MDTTPEYKKSPRRFIWFGLFLLALGIYSGKEALDSFHTGKPIYVRNAPAMEAWQGAGAAVLIVLLAGFSIAVGFGWIKSKDRH